MFLGYNRLILNHYERYLYACGHDYTWQDRRKTEVRIDMH